MMMMMMMRFTPTALDSRVSVMHSTDGEEAVAEEAGIVEMVGMVVTKWGVIVAHVESFVRECLRTCVSLPSLMDIYYVTSFPG